MTTTDTIRVPRFARCDHSDGATEMNADTTFTQPASITLSTTHSRAFAHQAIEALDAGTEDVCTEWAVAGCMCGSEPAVRVIRHGRYTYAIEAGRADLLRERSGTESEFHMLAQAHRRAALARK